MKNFVLSSAGLLLVTFLLIGGCNNDGGGGDSEPIISSTIPSEVEPQGNRSTPNNNDFDFFSWQAFIALNWPALNSGAPSPGFIGTQPGALRVWEHYADGGDPFSTDEEVEAGDDTQEVRSFVSDDSLQASSRAPLIDRYGNYFLYTVSINDEMVDYIETNGLTTVDGLAAFGETNTSVFFPSSSIELKLGWRVFPEGTSQETLDRYYVRDAMIEVADTDSKTGEAFIIENIKVGLIGMHITHKTPDYPQWVWSTFEHVDLTDGGDESVVIIGEFGDLDNNRVPNEISTGEAPKNPAGAPSYEYKWVDPSTGDTMASLYEKTVASRATNESSLPKNMNRIWQESLPEPWSNYRLIVTQRLNNAGDNAARISKDNVSIARNLGSETYIIADITEFTDVPQVPPVDPLDSCELNPDSSQSIAVELVEAEFNWPDNPEDFTTDSWSSCMQCHGFISFQYGTDATETLYSDYSYLFFTNLSEATCDTTDE